jgi:hypothetical protein
VPDGDVKVYQSGKEERAVKSGFLRAGECDRPSPEIDILLLQQSSERRNLVETCPAHVEGGIWAGGTVEKLDGNLAALSLSRGISLVARLDSEPRVNSVAKGSGSDLKAGSQVSIQAKSGQSGDLIATQIVLFGPGSNRPGAEPGPDNAQLVATIKSTNASPEGPVLTVADKDGDRKITIGPDTAVWIARAARITDIKVGSAVTMTGVKREDGSLQVLRATIGPAGAGNPPL